jgi:hypothetical protein
MRCEYCDSVIKTVPDNGICPNCGGVLPKNAEHSGKGILFPEPPVGVYKEPNGYLEIGNNSITFHRHPWPVAPKTERTILFEEICTVSFEYPKPFSSGTMCVRGWQDRYLPLARGTDAVTDPTAVYFGDAKTNTFRRLYEFLKQCADLNAKRNEQQ